MTRGKAICGVLKTIRKQVADANEIEYEPRECHHQGECRGTCPACEAEVRYLEQQLGLRRQLGRAVSIIGVSAGLLSACTQASTKVVTNKPHLSEGDVVCADTTTERMVVGEIAIPEEPDTASFVEEKQSQKAARTRNAPLVTQEEWDDEMVIGRVGEVAVEPPVAPDTTELFGDIAEQMPMFPGGDRKLMEYIDTNVQYPPECEEACTQGRVVVTFVVERDGSISHAKVVKSVDPQLDAEALRVVEAMPKWIPGRQNGVTVAIKYTIPVRFRLK